MKEIVILSGKGGTGKTSLTASFSLLADHKTVVADCDVDAADMHLLMQPDWHTKHEFFSGYKAVLDQEKCVKCGKCLNVCRFEAVNFADQLYSIVPLNCEGCSYCSHICPKDAIQMIEVKAGEWFISQTKANNTMVHARLDIGADNSGKLVAKIKKEAKLIAEIEKVDHIIIDGSPGIGCPVISSLTGADYVVFVTEPSVSGLHDLKRVYELVNKFNIPAGCIINKADLSRNMTQEIEQYLKDLNIDHISNLPYDESFTAAMVQGKTIMELPENKLQKQIISSWEVIKNNLKKIK